MFLDNLSKKQLNIIGILSISIATIFLLLVIVIPIFLKRQMTNNYVQKCNPTINNTNLWASFPGELNTNLTHHFSFFNYEKNRENYKINLLNNISLKEEVNYTNFSKDENNIYFYNNRSYQFLNEKKNGDNINSVNLGMFETLETLSYPSLYKIGINSIFYLIKKILIEPDVFIRELFAYNLKKTLKQEDIIENILKNLPQEKIDLILDNENEKYKKYSLNSTSGFFQWIKLLGSEEKVYNATWLWDIFSLTDEEIYSILLDQNSYLIKENKNFNDYLKQKFKCDGEQCDIKLLYLQLANSSVISALFPELKNFEELNTILKSNFYPFDKSPEMKMFYDNVYNKDGKGPSFDSVTPNFEQIDRLLNLNSKSCLLRIQNTLDFLHINKTENKQKKNDNYFVDLSYEQVNYLAEYFYNYLPKIFFLPQIDNDNDKNNINAEDLLSYGLLSKTFTNFIPLISENTYKNLINIDLLSYIIKPLTFTKIKQMINHTELDEICPIMMQKILDDGKKVMTICSDPLLNLMDEESVSKYIHYFYCLPKNKQLNKNCDSSLKDYFKSKVYLSETELDLMISEKSIIHEAFEYSLNTIKKIYDCTEKCGNDFLLKMQFTNCGVTKNAPDYLPKANSLREWFPELEDDYEMPFIINKYNKSLINYQYEDVILIADLADIKENDIYDLNNADIFYKKIKLEKDIFDVFYKKKESMSYNFYNLLMNVYVMDNNDLINNIIDNNNDISMSSLIVNYPSINNFLEGKSEENNYWINILNQGSYFENFKPKKESVTKFNFGFNFDTKLQEELNLDYIGISTKNADYNKRKYTNINNLLTLNQQKLEYDYFIDKTINTPFPLYNFEKILDDRKFSDGFQYDNNLEVIYYYDLISTRPLRFKKSETYNYQNKIECKKYILDTKSLNAGINEYFDTNNDNPFLTQKVNKPFIISDKIDLLKDYGYQDLKEEDFINYICIDPISDMVIDSKMNLIYALNTRKYNLINKRIKSDINLPLFLYQRNFEVEVNSYESLFPGVTEYYEKATTFIIIGVVIIVLFAAIGIIAFIYLNKKIKAEKTDETINSGDIKPIEEILTSKTDENK